MTRTFLRGIRIFFFCSLVILSSVSPTISNAQRVVNYNADDLVAHTEISITPPTGTFQEGSTFEVPIFIDTKGNSINAIELDIQFDPDKLAIIHPSGGKSIIGLWVEPPSYNNTKGTAKIVGTIPGGIVTGSGLIVTVTFQAKATGQAVVSLANNSNVLLNDGLGSPVIYESNRGVYSIVPKPPQGVTVYSDTHPFQDHWYNNNSPVLAWNKDPGVTGFSYILDDKPNTIPDNTVTATDTVKAYENLGDGMWYFHIKALKNNIWSGTTDYLVRIDTTPPAAFTPTTDYVSTSDAHKFLVSFFTTDSMSGIDHYEIGTIDKSQSAAEAPVFVQADSPFQIPVTATQNARVVVRAVDKAGNVADESIDIQVPNTQTKFITDHAVVILLAILGFLLFLILLYFLILFLRMVKKLRRAYLVLERDPERLQLEQEYERKKYRGYLPTQSSLSANSSLQTQIEQGQKNTSPLLPKEVIPVRTFESDTYQEQAQEDNANTITINKNN